MHDKFPYFSPDLARESVADTEKLNYDELVMLLQHDDLENQIYQGNITLAMVRPNVGPTANIFGLSDMDCAEKIEEMIEGLGVLAKFSVIFSEEIVEEFYDGEPKEVMLRAEPENPDEYDNRWPEFVKFMASGPTTIILLHSPNGDAIPQWRKHLGHWNIEKYRDEATIRGKLAVNVFNNLVHGSDAPESVLRELAIIRKCLEVELSTDAD